MICVRCQRERSNDCFHKARNTCKECVRETRKAYRTSVRGRLNIIYSDMRQRCFSTNDPCYHRYGGRGITICKEWSSFGAFYLWAKDRWTDGLEIDRIDNDGNYSPLNCRFVTSKENARNKSTTLLNPQKVISIRNAHERGESVANIARRMGVTWSCVGHVVNRVNWKDIP